MLQRPDTMPYEKEAAPHRP